MKMKHGLIALIRFYQWVISPMLQKSCRFAPTCSCYAIESIQQYGAFKGLMLTTLRLIKCQPFHSGGHDPVR
jgi:hypothetical protein